MGVIRPRPSRFSNIKDPVPILEEAGWPSQPISMGAENLARAGVRTLNRPALSDSVRATLPRPTIQWALEIFPRRKSDWSLKHDLKPFCAEHKNEWNSTSTASSDFMESTRINVCGSHQLSAAWGRAKPWRKGKWFHKRKIECCALHWNQIVKPMKTRPGDMAT